MSVTHPLQPSWTGSTYDDRFRAIEPYVRDRKVLDIGAVSGHRRPDWMHRRIHSVARRVVGVDIDADAIRIIQEQGFDIRLIDAQAMSLGEQFDVAFAGELIEHLSNCGEFLDSVRQHLVIGGQLVVTTPNAFCFSNFVYRFGFKARIHPEHTCWFCEDTLKSLLRRHGFAIQTVSYLQHTTPGRLRSAIAAVVHRTLPANLAWRTIMVVATRVD